MPIGVLSVVGILAGVVGVIFSIVNAKERCKTNGHDFSKLAYSCLAIIIIAVILLFCFVFGQTKTIVSKETSVASYELISINTGENDICYLVGSSDKLDYIYLYEGVPTPNTVSQSESDVSYGTTKAQVIVSETTTTYYMRWAFITDYTPLVGVVYSYSFQIPQRSQFQNYPN